MKITFNDLIEKRKLVTNLYGDLKNVNSKKEYAIQKWYNIVSKELEKVQTIYSTKFQEVKSIIEIENAKEKDGVVLKDEKGNFLFSKEGELKKAAELFKLAKDINEECGQVEIEFEPYLISLEILDEKSEFIIEELKDIFIKC